MAWFKNWKVRGLILLIGLLGVAWNSHQRQQKQARKAVGELKQSYRGPAREFVFEAPISSRYALITHDPVWLYLIDRIGGTQVDAVYVAPSDWMQIWQQASGRATVNLPWPEGAYVLSPTLAYQQKQMAPDLPEARHFTSSLPVSSVAAGSYGFQFTEALKWGEAFAQWLVQEIPLHQELFVLNADLLSTELMGLQTRWDRVRENLQSVEGRLREDEAQALGFSKIGKRERNGEFILEFLSSRNFDPGSERYEVYLKSASSGKRELVPLTLSPEAFLDDSWLKIWDENLSQLEAAMARLRS